MSNLDKKIPDISFIRKEANSIEFDIFRIEDFFRREIDHSIEKTHRIHFYLIFFATEGSGNHTVDFREIEYERGDVIFISDKQVQSFDIKLNTKGFIVLFTSGFLYRSESEKHILQNYRLFDYSLKTPKLSLQDDHFNHFKELFNLLLKEHNQTNKTVLQAEITHSLLKTILLKAENEKRDFIPNYEREGNYAEFVKFKNSLEENFHKTRNVSEYSRLIGVSPKRLNHLTKEIVSQTAKSFIDERVIIEIKRLLVHTNLSISEISELVGFDEPTNLVKYFKKHTKQTPSNFRQNQ